MPKITLPHNFSPRDYQVPFLGALDSGKKYAAIIWHRRSGKDLTCWNYAIKRAMQQRIDIVYIYPTHEMGRDNLWGAKTNGGRDFLDYVPMDIRERRNKADEGVNNTLKQVNFINGSTISLKSAEKPNRLRGGNTKLYILSEFPEMDPQVLDIIEPVVEANDGQIIVNGTPKGDNHAKASMEAWAKDPDWFTQIITAEQTDVFTIDQLFKIKNRIIERFKARGRSETEAVAFFEQEYMCSFESPVIGSYYGEAMRIAQDEGRIGNVPYEANLPVYTFWDIGVGDSTAIWFMQAVGRDVRLIDYYESSGEGVPHYIKVLKDKPYIYKQTYWPHDGMVREFGSGLSRVETAEQHGLTPEIIPQQSLEDGIEALRSLLGRCWFDEKKCDRGIKALKNYHKEWDDVNQVYKNKPKHDWSSHGSDAARYMAVGYRDNIDDSNSYVSAPTTSRPQQPMAINGIDVNSGIDAILNRGDDNNDSWML